MATKLQDNSRFWKLLQRGALTSPAEDDAHTEMALCCMKPGEQGHVLALHGAPSARQHLLEMGFTAGTVVEFVRAAPLGDPLTVRIRGYLLSLRRGEAEGIIVRRCPPDEL